MAIRCSNVSGACVPISERQNALNSSTPTQVLITDHIIAVFQLSLYGLICQAVNVFGTVTNIINIICFFRQGFKEAVNISLFVLAISDLGCLVTIMFTNITLVPAVQEVDLPFDPVDMQYLITGMPHIVFTRVTSSITALITLERCVCITMPLKVKVIFTPRRVTIMIIILFFFLIITVSPIFFVGRYVMKYVPERNKTILGLVFTEDRVLAEQVAFSINHVVMPFIALVIIAVCMIIIVKSLNKQAKWRIQISNSQKTDRSSVSVRDKNVAKMVLMISLLFIVCFTPSAMLFVAVVLVPGMSHGGKHQSVALLSYGICVFLESVNSSMNIFIYYNMSSRYRAVFRHLFSLDKKN